MDGKLCGGAEDVKARASLSPSIGESQGGDQNLRPETGCARKWNVGAGALERECEFEFRGGATGSISWRYE
jgi:hypothetical protein